MEKRSPHYVLADMQGEIARLSRRNFYKSMTTIRDHRIWQDVYHAPLADGRVAYVKLTLVAERPVIQFKEK